MPPDLKNYFEKNGGKALDVIAYLQAKHLGHVNPTGSDRQTLEKVAALARNLKASAAQQTSSPPASPASANPPTPPNTPITAQRSPTIHPHFVPNGKYPMGPEIVSSLRDYAIHLAQNPENMPRDIQQKFAAKQGNRPSFVPILQHLLVKHVEGYKPPPSPQQARASQAQTPAAPPNQSPAQKSSSMLEGQYPMSQRAAMSAQARKYATDLVQNPQMRPADVVRDLYASGGKEPSFPQVMRYLMTKHFVANPPQTQATQSAKPSSQPDPYAVSPFKAKFQPAGIPTHHGRPTRDSIAQGQKFYHERQGFASGDCGMHAINAFLGGPALNRSEYFEKGAEFVANQIAPNDPGTKAILKETLMNESMGTEGGDPAQLAGILKEMADSEDFDPRLNQVKVQDNLHLPTDPQARQNLADHYNQYPGDRLIYGRNGHFVAFRKNSANEWMEINSLRSTQEKVNLGKVLTQNVPFYSVISMGGFDFSPQTVK